MSSGTTVGPPPAGAAQSPSSTLTSVRLTAANRLLTQGVQFILVVLLARLLTPADFGIYAIVIALYYFFQAATQVPLVQAIVQSRSCTANTLNAAFTLLIGANALSCAALLLAAESAAAVTGEPAVADALRLMALSCLMCVGTVHLGQLERRRRFGVVLAVEVSAAVAGGLLTLALAVGGHGALSLVFGLIFTTGWTHLGYCVALPWRPSPRAARQDVRELAKFLRGVAGAAVVHHGARSADNLILGASSGATQLGIYSRAYNLMLLPVTQMTWATSRAVLPQMRSVADRPAALCGTYVAAMAGLMTVALPVSCLLIIAAEPVVELLLGPQWDDAAPVLQLLAVGGLMQPLHATTGWLFQVRHRTGAWFVWSCAFSAGYIVLFVLGVRAGAAGVALAFSVMSLALTPLHVRLSAGLLGVPTRTLVVPLLRPCAAALTAGLFTASMPPLLSSPAGTLLWTTALLLVVYGSVLASLRDPVLLRAVSSGARWWRRERTNATTCET